MIGAIFALGIVLTASSLGEIEAKGRAVVEEDSRLLERVGDLRMSIQAALESSHVTTPDFAAFDLGAQRRRTTAADIEVLGRMHRPEEAEDLEALRGAWHAADEGLGALAERTVGKEAIIDARILASLTKAARAITRIEDTRRAASLARVREIRLRVRDARVVLFLFVIITVIIGISVTEILRRRILLPIRRLEMATARVAQGDLSHSAEEGEYPDDEIGDLARRFDFMADRLARTETARMEFLAMVSHEIRSPLMVIQGYLGLLEAGKRGPLAPAQTATIGILRAESHRMATLVEDLLDAADAGGGGFRVKPIPTRTAHDLGEALEPFAGPAAERRIGWTVDLTELPDAVVDPKRLGQAVRNLVGNALKFTPPGGRISVSGRMEGGDLVLSVSDTGPGIPLAHRGNLFELFFQVDPSASAKGSVGLGLTIVRAIARAHGGEVEVASEEGKGTTFTIRIPHRPVPSGVKVA